MNYEGITMKTLKAFSLIELTISLITISCIMAAFAPIITKKLKISSSSSSPISTVKPECSKFSEDCKLCDSNSCLICNKNCNENEYKNISSCECEPCTNRGEKCLTCNANKCTKCDTGYGITKEGGCEICNKGYYSDKTCKPCPTGQYQNQEAKTSCINCPAGKYQDEEGQSLCKNSPSGSYVNSQGATNYTPCPTGQYQNQEAKTSCINCPAGKYQDEEGQTLCKTCPAGKWSEEKATSCTNCLAGYKCDGSGTITICQRGYYAPLGSSTCSLCPIGTTSSKGSASCSSCPVGTTSSAGAASCTSCSTLFENCTQCSPTECTACADNYELNNGKCELSGCPANTIEVDTGISKLCVTQYNMGDKTEFPVNVSGVKVVSTGTNCSANACCWQGKTGDPCDSNNGDYSGCNRTVCTYYAAKIICNNLNYGGRSWRLPTRDEIPLFFPSTYSINIGTSGLMLCDDEPGYGSAQCSGHNVCSGSYTGKCYAREVWSSTTLIDDSSRAWGWFLSDGEWAGNKMSKRQAYSVRCVSEL